MGRPGSAGPIRCGLTANLPDTTVIQLTGNAVHLVAEACSIARALQPAMVVIEDVDLIAEDRVRHLGQHPLLFQLRASSQ